MNDSGRKWYIFQILVHPAAATFRIVLNSAHDSRSVVLCRCTAMLNPSIKTWAVERRISIGTAKSQQCKAWCVLNSFSYEAAGLWNNLPSFTKEAASVTSSRHLYPHGPSQIVNMVTVFYVKFTIFNELSGFCFWLISSWTKWPPSRRIFCERILMNERFCILIRISLKFVPKGPR